MLLGIMGFWHGGCGSSHKVHGHSLKKMKTLVEAIRESRLTYAKPLKVAWGI
jgi:hypothetical protein